MDYTLDASRSSNHLEHLTVAYEQLALLEWYKNPTPDQANPLKKRLKILKYPTMVALASEAGIGGPHHPLHRPNYCAHIIAGHTCSPSGAILFPKRQKRPRKNFRLLLKPF